MDYPRWRRAGCFLLSGAEPRLNTHDCWHETCACAYGRAPLTPPATRHRDPEEFDEFFHVNVAGLFATIKAFYPLLKAR
jgi:NAD(P)-dependent dehydrogenase (short-subunit alcohol dehydrogenase family)